MKKIFSYIFIFIFVFLTCYFNVSAISLRNYGGIKGYEYNGTNSYNCHGYATGVIQIGDEYGNDYFCSQCGKQFPNHTWAGSSTFYDYQTTGTCYYSCNNPNTGSYATTQHNIWDIMENNPKKISCSPSNSEILNACSNGTLYLLTEYGYQNYQKVVTLSTETYYQPVSQTIYVSKVCNNGLTGTFVVELVKDNTVYKTGSISCGDSEKAIFGSSLPTGTYLIREKEDREDVLYDTEGEITLTSGKSAIATFTNSLKKGNVKVNKVCKTGVSGTFKIGIYKNNVLFESESKDVSCGGNVTFDLPVGNYTIKEINPDSKYNVEYSSSSVTVKANETSEVTVTNSLKPGKVTVTKECTGYITNNQKFKITLNNVTKEFSCNTSYTWDNLTPGDYTLTEEMLVPDVDISNKKDIIIYHTHTCESYTPSEAYNYTMTGNYRTTDANYNVIRVGTELTNYLAQKGFNVIHDGSYNDYPSYSGSYDRSLEVASRLIDETPSDIVLDIHRDAVGNGDTYGPTIMIDGNRVAQMMFVIGTDGGGLEHPNWNQNLKIAIKIQEKANQMYPGLFRSIVLRNSRYNQHVAKGASIIEVGATANTLEECLLSMQCLANVLEEVCK